MSIALVTGGAGFIGSHLVAALLARGKRVRVLDQFSSGTLANLPLADARLEIAQGDTNDPLAVAQAADGVTEVFHLAIARHAAEASAAIEHWAASDTLNVLAAAQQAGVRRVIFASCQCVYEPEPVKQLTEADPTLPRSAYALAKLTGEQQCVAFSAIFGLETVRLRYSHVFGPRMYCSVAPGREIKQITKDMLLGIRPVLEGDGDEPHDFVYVDDVVHASLLAAEARRVSGKVYNIARGRPTTLNQVVATLNRLLGTELQPAVQHAEATERGTRLLDIGRAEADLGFCPATDLEQGLQRCIDYYQLHPEELTASSRAASPMQRGPHFAVAGLAPALAELAVPTAQAAPAGRHDGHAIQDDDVNGPS